MSEGVMLDLTSWFLKQKVEKLCSLLFYTSQKKLREDSIEQLLCFSRRRLRMVR